MTEATPCRSHSPAKPPPSTAHHQGCVGDTDTHRPPSSRRRRRRAPTLLPAYYYHPALATSTTSSNSNYDASAAAADVAAAGVSQLSIDFPIPRDQRSSMRAARYFEHKHRLARHPRVRRRVPLDLDPARCTAADEKAAPDSTRLDSIRFAIVTCLPPRNAACPFGRGHSRCTARRIVSRMNPRYTLGRLLREVSSTLRGLLRDLSLRIGSDFPASLPFPRTRSPT